MLKGFFRANPYHHQRLKIFATEKPRLDAIIFPLNSPVKEVMKLAMSRMFESGGVEYLLDKWEGRGIPQFTGKVIPSGCKISDHPHQYDGILHANLYFQTLSRWS